MLDNVIRCGVLVFAAVGILHVGQQIPGIPYSVKSLPEQPSWHYLLTKPEATRMVIIARWPLEESKRWVRTGIHLAEMPGADFLMELKTVTRHFHYLERRIINMKQ